jgi:NAD(P)H-dependent flavin oxidoreductase YrpB (nitropropane dioxygenase family)
MRTEICEKLGIEFPIFAFSHCADVVTAVSRAGGFGVLGAVGYTPEQLAVELDRIDQDVGGRPYGVDVVIPTNDAGEGETDPEKLHAGPDSR